MSVTFTKLFSSITESTIWCEPANVRIVWITMLAMADSKGRVFASIPGLANRARVPLADCESAIQTFLSPDPYSRTKDHEGRRIEPIDGGWRLLNHAKYRAIRDEESIRESKRRYIADRRQRERDLQSSTTSTVEQGRHNAEADTEAEAKNGTPIGVLGIADATPSAKDAKREQQAERLAQVTREAVAAYNAILGKPNGRLVAVTLPDSATRRQQVKRCLRAAAMICADQFGDKRVTPEFWAAYFGEVARDAFLSGVGPYTGTHANWRPDFEYLTRPEVLEKVFDKAVSG